MKKRTLSKKLSLRKITVSNLGKMHLDKARGGCYPSVPPTCPDFTVETCLKTVCCVTEGTCLVTCNDTCIATCEGTCYGTVCGSNPCC